MVILPVILADYWYTCKVFISLISIYLWPKSLSCFLALERCLVRIYNQWRLDGQKHCDLINIPAVSETVVLWGLHLVPELKPDINPGRSSCGCVTSLILPAVLWTTHEGRFSLFCFIFVYMRIFCLFFAYVTGPDPICFVSKLRTLRFLSCRIKTLIWILCIRVELGPKWQTPPRAPNVYFVTSWF